MKFDTGSIAYIVESNRIVREVKIVKRNGSFYIVRFGISGESKYGAIGCLRQRKLRNLP